MIGDHLLYEHLFTISLLSPWFADIENFLVDGQFPPNLSSKKKRKNVRTRDPYTWIGVNLFRLGPYYILRRCVREYEVFYILSSCHDGPCGGHFSAKVITFKVLQE